MHRRGGALGERILIGDVRDDRTYQDDDQRRGAHEPEPPMRDDQQRGGEELPAPTTKRNQDG
jgi:hypothetical protein